MMRILLALGLALMLASPALADAVPAQSKLNNDCTKYVMCDEQDDAYDGVCKTLNGAGDEIVVRIGTRSTLTFYTTQSTSGTYTCDVYSNDQGFDASGGDGQQINSSSMTEDYRVYSISGLLEYVWLYCDIADSGGGNDDVTVTMLACPMSR